MRTCEAGWPARSNAPDRWRSGMPVEGLERSEKAEELFIPKVEAIIATASRTQPRIEIPLSRFGLLVAVYPHSAVVRASVPCEVEEECIEHWIVETVSLRVSVGDEIDLFRRHG